MSESVDMSKPLKTCIIFISSFVLCGFFYLGPPFKESEKLKLIPENVKVVVGITHVVLKSDAEQNDLFWENTFAVVDSLPNHPGYLGHRIRKKLFSDDGWTMTIWRDDESLNNFVHGDMHRQAMGRGLPAVKKARFLRLSLPRSEVPLSWQKVAEIMDEKGRALY